ncbi:MAG: DUF4328 domain-containing protein [Pseudomonadota bacterium]
MNDADQNGHSHEGLQKLAFWTRWTCALLALCIPFILFDLFESVMFVNGGFENWSYDSVTTYDSISATVAYVNLGVTVISTAVFGRWIYVAASNLVDYGVEQFEYTPGWSVGWFFIPIANLFKPYQAMRQIWNGSRGSPGGDIDANHTLLIFWWGSWLATGIAGNISFRTFMTAEFYEDFYRGYSALLVSSLASLVLFPIAYQLVVRVNSAQQSWTDYRSVFD